MGHSRVIDKIEKRVKMIDRADEPPDREFLPDWKNSKESHYKGCDVYTNDFIAFASSLYANLSTMDSRYKVVEMKNDGDILIVFKHPVTGIRMAYVHEEGMIKGADVDMQDVKEVLCNDFSDFIRLLRV